MRQDSDNLLASPTELLGAEEISPFRHLLRPPFLFLLSPLFSSPRSSAASSQSASERKERNPRACRWSAGQFIPRISDSIPLIPPPISFPPLRPVPGRIWVAKIIDSRGSFRYLLFPFFPFFFIFRFVYRFRRRCISGLGFEYWI
ncbi:hypothetical protein B296_00009203 [Ensete ventricosum]|uniref:Uncharacterized protein n=1 Tax=Ensete ventricosum TaxID=4639 RepID=A0A426ZYM4_ENSVE|nr:hypothetical protein B296_00009203 [Ensete ventricosum]